MKIPLASGAYEARSLIADAQRCVNLYPEINPPDSPFPTTHYPTPGLAQFARPVSGVVRQLYRASNGILYAVIGQGVYKVLADGSSSLLGSLLDALGTPASMADNGLVIIIVDGSSNGYMIDIATDEFQQIHDVAFYGATRVDYVDTYFTFNRPGTKQWYISLSNVDFDMLKGGQISNGTITDGGHDYPQSVEPPALVYTDVPLTGGTGTGAIANLSVNGISNEVTNVEIVDGGIGYSGGDVLSATVGGAIDTISIVTAGSGYTDGVFLGAELLGGTGHGAKANITVSGASITVIGVGGTSGRAGIQYQVGDILTFNSSDGLGTGFTASVDAISAPGSGLAYTVSALGATGFDPLDIASKTGASDLLVTQIVMHREVWLIGERTTEVWYNTGASDFTYGIMPGVFIQHGCIAPYSVASQDLSIFWVSEDPQGNRMVLMGSNYQAARISTHAIEFQLSKYSTVSDAIGYTYQQGGHTFYVLTFPTAEKTWVYDISSQLWHERAALDSEGNLVRHRSNCAANVYGMNLVGDYINGKIYQFDLDLYEDDGSPIPRIRSFPHIQNEGKRVLYSGLIADMEVGNLQGALTDDDDPIPQVSLRWSDTRGVSFGNSVQQSLGAGGQYMTSIQWSRLGLARDRVFELSWSAPVKTALNGVYITLKGAAT